MWKTLSSSDFRAMKEARIQLHQASQFVAAIGRCYNEPDPGDSHATLSWDNNLEGLIGKPIQNSELRAYLRFEDLTIGLFDRENSWSIDLDQLDINEAQSAVQGMVAKVGLDLGRLTFKLPYIIPEYPISLGSEKFEVSHSAAYKEFEHYYSDANDALNEFLSTTDKASEISCWPHHFDIATLVTLVENDNPEEAKSIGVGFSPGDDNYNEPYFYLTPPGLILKLPIYQRLTLWANGIQKAGSGGYSGQAS